MNCTSYALVSESSYSRIFIESQWRTAWKTKVCHFSECKSNWYQYEDKCWQECPIGSYAITEESTIRKVCGRCHYSCLTCSGATDGECTTCHSDSNLLTNFGETQCVLQNLAWRFESTMWFYWLTIFFSINALIVVLAMIYVGVNWYIRRSNSSTYDYSKVAYSSNGDARKNPMEVSSPMGIQSTVLMEMKRTEEEEEKELESIC
ncbi:hypothetical protein V1477_006859 [Vespula maculifrons]|uniref:Uncharacterized protein n=1 Tax=Vespula maculifrons TaxID=7453 RepID=A0ABD2CGX8_VESMC